LIEKFSRSVDDVEMSVRYRIEAARINRPLHRCEN
jgi:hypothetical protein